MKTKINIILALSLLVFLGLTSCNKDSVNSSGMALKVQAVNRAFSLPAANTSGPISPNPGALPAITWDVATLGVSQITLEATPMPTGPVSHPNSIERTWFGPMLVDLFNLSQTLGKIQLPAGAYSEIEYRVDARPVDPDPSVLYLSGMFTNSVGKQIPLIVNVTDAFVYVAEKNNITVQPGGSGTVDGVVVIYLNRLFSSILPRLLEEATVMNGTITISADSNQALYQVILASLNKHPGDNDVEGNGTGTDH